MSSDKDAIPAMLALASSEAGIARLAKAVKPIAPDYGTVWPHNCCALFQSELLNQGGIRFGYEASAGRFAYKLGGHLKSRNWEHIPVGRQQPGDIGVCFDDDPSIPGADHIYFVVQRIDSNEMEIADNQRAYPHRRCADGTNVGEGRKTRTEYFLRAPGMTQEIEHDDEYVFADIISVGSDIASGKDLIISYAQKSKFLKFNWGSNQGVMPKGYIKGMALAYARCVCKLASLEAEAIGMAIADRRDSKTDALTWYAAEFAKLGLDNSRNGAGVLRNLFNLLIGLGVPESSGRYYCGRDVNANFVESSSAEAGLFQASYGARKANSSMEALYQAYKGRTDFLDVFKEGASAPDAGNLKNWSQPSEDPLVAAEGLNWQKLTKESPAFAAEYAALCLRYNRREFGTIRDRVVQISQECDAYLRGVDQVIEENGIQLI